MKINICLKSTRGLTSSVWDVTCDLTVRGYDIRGKKNAFSIQLETAVHIWAGTLLCVCTCVCACVLECMHACLWMCVSVYVWVCACKFSISPWATPTHPHVSHSVSEKDPVRQSNLYPNWYDCRLAVFIWVFHWLICLLHLASQTAVMFLLVGVVSRDKARP